MRRVDTRSDGDPVRQEAMHLGEHVQRIGSSDFLMHDATGFLIGTVEVGCARAAVMQLMHYNDRHAIGLVACLSAENARGAAANLIAVAEQLEAGAADIAEAAIRKAGGRIAQNPITETVCRATLDADDRAGRATAPFRGAPGHSLIARVVTLNRAVAGTCLATGIVGALWILGRAAWAALA